MRPAVSFLLICTLASCTEPYPDVSPSVDCNRTDWRALGYQDGARGAAFDAYNSMAAACEAQGAPANRLAYATGRLEGLRTYCTYEQGYADGYGRRNNSGVCSGELAPAYEKGYREGIADDRAPTINWPSFGIGVGGGSSGSVGIGAGVGIGF